MRRAGTPGRRLCCSSSDDISKRRAESSVDKGAFTAALFAFAHVRRRSVHAGELAGPWTRSAVQPVDGRWEKRTVDGRDQSVFDVVYNLV